MVSIRALATKGRGVGAARAALLAAALCLAGTVPASAHVRWSIGVGIGVPGYYGGYGPGWWPGPYVPYTPYPYYYPPPAVIVAPPAAVYSPWQPPAVVEPAPLGPPPPSYWYYCYNPAGYYPQVPDCPGGWTPVPAQAPAHAPLKAPPAPAPH